MAGYDCVRCGRHHEELPSCFLLPLPLPVHQVPERERPRRVERGTDLCVLDAEHFFILGNLDVKVQESSDFIRWTVWTSLSQANFARALDLWEVQGRESESPYFGWLCNLIPGYEPTFHVKTNVHTQPVGTRPLIEVEPDHPLGIDQRDGISRSRYDELVHAAVATLSSAPEPGGPKRPWWMPWRR